MNLNDLFNSTRKIRKSQNDVGRISLAKYKHFKRNKQFILEGSALPSTGKTQYKMNVVFDRVESSDTQTKIANLEYYNEYGDLAYYIAQPTVKSQVRVKCTCKDFYFRWEYYDQKQKSLVGRHKAYKAVPGSNRPPVNPQELPGLCKHLIALVGKLIQEGTVKK